MTRVEELTKLVLQSHGFLRRLDSQTVDREHTAQLQNCMCHHQCGLLEVATGAVPEGADSQAIQAARNTARELHNSNTTVYIWQAGVAQHATRVWALTEEYKRLLSLPQPQPPEPPPETPDWICTSDQSDDGEPGTITNVRTGEVVESRWVLRDLLGSKYASSSGRNRPSLIGPGERAYLMPGDYRHFFVSLDVWVAPVTVTGALSAEGQRLTRIVPNPVSGSHTVKLEAGGNMVFQNLELLTDDRFTIGTENPWSQRWGGNFPGFGAFTWVNCWMDGDAVDNEKWGVLTWGMQGWTWLGGGGRSIRKEHLMGYFHNPQGPVLIEGAEAEESGLNMYQEVNREWDYEAGPIPPSRSETKIARCKFRNSGLRGGGSAITCGGRKEAAFTVQSTSVINEGLGDNGLSAGCLVFHLGGGGNGEPTREVYLIDSRFEATRCDRPVASVEEGSVERHVHILGTTHFASLEGSKPALSIAGPKELYTIGPKVTSEGSLHWNGTRYETMDDLRAALQA